MRRFITNLLRSTNPARSRRRDSRPNVEGLEDRIVLFTTNGGMWTYPVRITYSFMPDGTNLGGINSNLYATLNAVESTAAWQQAFEQAAAIWSQSANLNLALVSDNGAPEGTSGNQQDDSRFGDIRIGMFNQGPGYLASTNSPPPNFGGTDAGDIFFNSYYNWNPSGGYDLESVALHELGHALGLGESTVSGSVMYAYYGGVNINPSSDDLAGIKSIYGAVPGQYNSNHSFATAYNLSSMINGSGQLALANQSILGGNDTDYWYVTVPSNTTGTMTVTMQAQNLSSLAPRLSIYNSAQQGLAMNAQANVYGGNATIIVKGVSPGQGYYLVLSSASGIGSVGAYGLLANFGSSYQAPIAPPNTVVASQPDQGGGAQNDNVDPNYVLINDTVSWVDTLETQLANGTFQLSSWLDLLTPAQLARMVALGLTGHTFTTLPGGSVASYSSVQSTMTPTSPVSVVVNIAGTPLSRPATSTPSTLRNYPGVGS